MKILYQAAALVLGTYLAACSPNTTPQSFNVDPNTFPGLQADRTDNGFSLSNKGRTGIPAGVIEYDACWEKGKKHFDGLNQGEEVSVTLDNKCSGTIYIKVGQARRRLL